MKFRDLSIARKLGVGFGVVLFLVTASSAALLIQIRQVQQIGRTNSASDEVIDLADRIEGDVYQTRYSAFKFLLNGDAAEKAQTKAKAAELNAHLATLTTILTTYGPQFIADVADYRTKADQYIKTVIDPELDLATSAATHAQAVAMLNAPATATSRAAVDDAFKALREKVDAWSNVWTDAQDRALDQIELVALALGAITLLLGGLMAWLIVRAIRGPVTALTGAMLKLASGDSTLTIPALDQPDEVGQMAKAVQVFKQAAIDKTRIEADGAALRRSSDEERSRNEAHRADAAKEQAHIVASIATGLEHLAAGNLAFRLADPFAADYEKLRGDFNNAIEKLAGTMTVVMANATAMHSGTTEISSASDDLARRTEQQAASLEETTAALGEITTTVRKTAEGASHARQVVSAAKKDAEQSGLIVGQAVDAMGGIEKSSGQISQIISVIDEIAFQTNLLALNAGVEAARAGDAGRGFAVVASEVRALAQRSAEAAKEIKTLIHASSQHVAAGVSLVGQTGKALDGIVAQITDINDVVVKIASSAQEQAVALDQINTAVVQMDQVTQQNAAMVEEATAASHSLAQEADALSRLVSRFKTGQQPAGGDTARSAPGKPAARPRSAPALKTVGRSGAARQPAPAASEDNWEEF